MPADRTGHAVSLCGALFDTIIMATEHDFVKSMREQTRLYNESVQTAGKGHKLGPPQIWAWGGLIAGLQKRGRQWERPTRITPGSAGPIGRTNPSRLASRCRSTDQECETQS